MTLVRHEPTERELSRRFEFFDRFFDDLPDMFRRPVMFWPTRGGEPFRVEEFTDEGSYVVRVELAGIDPEKDVEISVENGILHIAAERHEAEKSEGRDYVRRAALRLVPSRPGAAEGDQRSGPEGDVQGRDLGGQGPACHR